MYGYDDIDQTLVDQRVNQFRDQVARRLSGELSEDQFKPLRLMNGLYLQLHAYMLRVAIPYGTFSSRQMAKLAEIGRRYDRGYGHFTTRQNLQFNWPTLSETPDILSELASVQMHAIQTSGNCIRNTTTDPFAGASADEIADPRPYCEIIRQWSSLHPEFTFLPRKFKIAVTGSAKDRAATKVHDIGLRLVQNDAGEIGFEVSIGGGLGRTPMIAKIVRPFLLQPHLLSYLEAILRVYNRYGRRDNKYKARIKILVHEVGIDPLREQIEAEWDSMKDSALLLAQEEITAMQSHFPRPAFISNEGQADLAKQMADHPGFARWVRSNTEDHLQEDHRIAVISLKPIGGIPGDITSDQMDLVADLAAEYGYDDIRATMEQNLVLPHIAVSDLFTVWQKLEQAGLATPNRDQISDITACPGLDYCALANARSIPLSQQISDNFADLREQEDLGPLKIKISGCINACAHHHVADIGILGVDKKGQEFYQITLGGHSGGSREGQTFTEARVGKLVGPAVTYEAVPATIRTIIETYLAQRTQTESFAATVDRLGIAPFKEALYA